MTKTQNNYIIPISKKDRKLIASDSRVHTGALREAIDFIVPEGTEVLAACDGEVIHVKVDSKQGGFEDKFNDFKFLNSIIIKHTNGEFSEYSHLKFKGSLVKIGHEVKSGSLIGYSGNTGYTTEPHLHFHVCTRGDIEDIGKTLEVKFKEKIKIIK